MSRQEHRAWCGRGHHCRPELGEHTGEPLTGRTRYGSIVARRVDGPGRSHVEVTVSFRRGLTGLDPHDEAWMILSVLNAALDTLVPEVDPGLADRVSLPAA